ncbi:hypothetical protein E6W99_17360 [Metabacillus sediminilitoris]|uniref:Uncharacterized protein n=1 Tax=Metabacillus sediminilitoris TaxID=2567941 RepID=A0A4S4BSJ8_9BACI|nr:hypothetical protein E6W99_17360 [Metabacillus sediminilitoris]
MIGADCETPAGVAGQVRLMQAFTPRRLTARPAESEHLSLQSTTPHDLVNSNKVYENNLVKTIKSVQNESVLYAFFNLLAFQIEYAVHSSLQFLVR